MRCSQLREMAPDVALGLLTGEERAAALEHLESCEACRADVASLAVTADEVLLTAPELTPPHGFDARVLARLEAARAPTPLQGRRRTTERRRSHPGRSRLGRRRTLVAVAIATAAAALVLVAAVIVSRDDRRASTVAAAEMRTGPGLVVGQATLRDDPSEVAVELPRWNELETAWGGRGGATYWLAIELKDGSRTMAQLTDHDAFWDVPLDVDAHQVVAVSVLDDEGRVWCTGRFTT